MIVLRRPAGNRIDPKLCGTMTSRAMALALVKQLEKAESVVHDLFLEATDDGIEALEAVLEACRQSVMRRGRAGCARPGAAVHRRAAADAAPPVAAPLTRRSERPGAGRRRRRHERRLTLPAHSRGIRRARRRPVDPRVDTAIFERRYFGLCLQCTFCGDACCQHGVDVSVVERDRILAHADALEPIVGVPRSALVRARPLRRSRLSRRRGDAHRGGERRLRLPAARRARLRAARLRPHAWRRLPRDQADGELALSRDLRRGHALLLRGAGRWLTRLRGRWTHRIRDGARRARVLLRRRARRGAGRARSSPSPSSV